MKNTKLPTPSGFIKAKQGELKPNQIGLCNLYLKTVNKKGCRVRELILKDTVFAYGESGKQELLEYNKIEDRRIICRTGLKEDLIITNIDVISTHGFRNLNQTI